MVCCLSLAVNSQMKCEPLPEMYLALCLRDKNKTWKPHCWQTFPDGIPPLGNINTFVIHRLSLPGLLIPSFRIWDVFSTIKKKYLGGGGLNNQLRIVFVEQHLAQPRFAKKRQATAMIFLCELCYFFGEFMFNLCYFK